MPAADEAPGDEHGSRRLLTRHVAHPAVEIFLWTRGAIWLAALFALLVFEPNRHPAAASVDSPLNHDVGYVVDVWARYDSAAFVSIAQEGYQEEAVGRSAFFPLYPAVVGALGRALAGHYVLAGVIVSLACALVAFVLLYRLAEARLGTDGARRAVLYLAVFPTAFFLQAVYSESLFLMLALAAFLAAERGLFVEAGALAGLAWLTRPVGLALVAALAVIAWRADDRRVSLAGLALAPALFALYPLALWWQLGDPLASVRAEEFHGRNISYAGPLGGLWDAASAAWSALAELASAHPAPRDVVLRASPTQDAVAHLESSLYLCLFVVLAVLAWRRFGAAYGIFAAVSLAIPLTVPRGDTPLFSLPRFGLVVFPLFLALAALGTRPRVHAAILAVSALALGVNVVRWALWQFVA